MSNFDELLQAMESLRAGIQRTREDLDKVAVAASNALTASRRTQHALAQSFGRLAEDARRQQEMAEGDRARLVALLEEEYAQLPEQE